MRQIIVASTLTLVASAASGATPVASAPVLSPQQIDNVRSDTKVVKKSVSYQGAIGPWNGTVYVPAAPREDFEVNAGMQISDEPIAMAANPGDLEIFQTPTNQRRAAIRINDGLDHVGAALVPPVADEAGLDHLDIATPRPLYEADGNCTHYKLVLKNVYTELPFSSTSLTGDFATGRKVKSDFNLPGAEVHAEVQWTATHFNGPWWCISTPMNYTAAFTVRDLDGSLDVTLGTAGGAVTIDTVDAVSFSVDDFEWDTNSWILNTLISLGFGLYDLFDFTCSGQADCLSEAVNEYALSDDDFIDEMVDMVNRAVGSLHNWSEGFSTEGLSSTFSAALESVQSSTAENTLTSLWDVDVSSSATVDPCASGLYTRAFAFEGAPGNASLTNNDFEVELPFHLISDTAYLAGKRGVFCAAFNYSILNVSRGFSVLPSGSIGVAGAGAGDPANTVKLSLPIRITPTSGGVTGSVSGTLNVKGALGVDAYSDLVFTTRSASVSGLTGSVSVGGATVNAASLSSAINGAVGDVVSEMDDLELANALAHTGIGDVSIAVGDIVTSGSALVVGLDIR
jgi:hypothetical protein